MRHLPVLALLCSIGCNAQHAARVHHDDEGDGGAPERSDSAAMVTDPGEDEGDDQPDDATTPKDASSSSDTRDAGAAADAAASDASVLDGGSATSDAASCDNTALKVTLTLRQQPPDVSIVLDRSGSMQPMSGIDCSKTDIGTVTTCNILGIDCNDPAYKGTVSCGGSAAVADRWTPAVSALKSYTAMFDAKVSFGLTLFPGGSNNGTASSCTAGEERVALGLQHAAAIAAVLDMTKPYGNTPTGATLDVVRAQIQTRKAQANGELAAQYVLLVTDGQATCPTSSSGTANTEAHAATLRAIDALSAVGVTTFVLGLDGMNVQLAKQLTEYAVHGGSGDFYAVEAGSSFAPRLAEITAGTVDCDFALNQLPPSGQTLRVELEGTELLRDTNNGYTREGLSLHLRGAACARVRTAGVLPSASSVCTP